ncbi:MAG: hypothetical protein RL753_407, partial [Bacteroidota bacterium]
EVAEFLSECIKAANTRTPNDAYAVFVGVRSFESRVSYGLLSSDKPEVGAAVHTARLFAFNKVFDVEVLDLAGKLRFVIGRVKAGNGSRPAAALEEGRPKCGSSITDRGQGTKARDYDTFEFHNTNLGLGGLDVRHSLTYSLNAFGLIVRNLDVEFFFELHDELNRIE